MSCNAHPGADETRQCTRCTLRWCDACVRRVNHREICPSCGCLVRRAAAPKTSGEQASDLVRRVISVEGLITAVAFGLCYALSLLVTIAIVFYLAAVVGYYFTIIAHVGDNRPGLPTPADTVDGRGSTVTLVAQGIMCATLGALPILLWMLRTHRTGLGPADLPTAAVLGAIGQIYMPAALLSLMFTGNTVALIWPPVWIKVISRAPRAYVRFLGLWFVTIAIGAAIVRTYVQTDGGSMIVALGFAIVWNLYLFGQATLIGDFVRLNGDAFGWHE